jgi:1,4-dihydroxy-2-naphthoate octaprenyltransferase
VTASSTVPSTLIKVALGLVVGLVLVGVLTVYFDNLLFAGLVVAVVGVGWLLYRGRRDADQGPPDDQSTLEQYE